MQQDIKWCRGSFRSFSSSTSGKELGSRGSGFCCLDGDRMELIHSIEAAFDYVRILLSLLLFVCQMQVRCSSHSAMLFVLRCVLFNTAFLSFLHVEEEPSLHQRPSFAPSQPKSRDDLQDSAFYPAAIPIKINLDFYIVFPLSFA